MDRLKTGNPIQDFISMLADPRNEAATNPQNFPEATYGGVANNVVTGAANFAKGLINMPGQILNGVLHPTQGLESLKNTVTGVASNANNLLGEPVKVENGNVTGVQVPSLLHAAQSIYNDPVNAGLMLEGAKGIVKGKPTAKVAEDTSLPPKLNLVSKAGEKLKSDIAPIRVKPSIYGAADEAAIAKTVQNEVPGVTAAEKYANLQPTMQRLSNQIQAELTANPKSVPIEDVKAAYLENVKGVLRSKELTPEQANLEITDYLTNLYKDRSGAGNASEISLTAPEKFGNVDPTQLTTKDLFDMKTQANSDFQRALQKQANGQPLNITEQVQLAGRKTLDDIITREHPLVKEMTLKQSNLYDAAPSLSAARDINHGFTALGTNVPSSLAVLGKNALGSTLKGAGNIVSGIGPIASGIGAVAPTMISSENQQQLTPPSGVLPTSPTITPTPNKYQDQTGNFVLPTSTTAGSTYMTDAKRRELQAPWTFGTTEYNKIQEQFANEQSMAQKAMPAETMDLMTKAPIIFKFANLVKGELNSPDMTSFMNGIAKGKYKDFKSYTDATGKFVQGMADIDQINNAYTAAMAASSAKLGQALPGPDQLISPGDSPMEAQTKLSRMMENIGSVYDQFKEPFLAISSPSGTLDAAHSQPVGAPAIPQGDVVQPNANMKMDLSHLLPIGGAAPGLTGLPQLGQ